MPAVVRPGCELVDEELAAALDRLGADVVVAPSARAVAIAQDRIAEKSFLRERGVPTAPWSTGEPVGYPAIVKTARLGYDGKGQVAVDDRAGLRAALDGLGVRCVVEQRVPLDLEVSVVVRPSAVLATTTYPVAENHHADGILDLTVVPARIPVAQAAEAQALAVRIAELLEYVGVLAVELFVSAGDLLVNELAPRPHNSGHWTLDACVTSQFAQQVRAVCGLALGPTDITGAGAVAMVNLLGDVWDGGPPEWAAALADADARLHLYGKAEPRPGRKMGHLTVLGATPDDVAARAVALRAAVTR